MDRTFFQDLNTKRLTLRNISLEDADFFYKVYSHPLVCKYLFDEETVQSVNEAAKWINVYNNDAIYHNRWVIVSKEDGLRLGTCGFHNWDYRNKRVEIGYDLLPEYWGKGYMHEALVSAIGFAFDKMIVHRISAHVYIANSRSVKVLERLGFEKEGVLKDFYCFRGKYYDHFLYSLLRSER